MDGERAQIAYAVLAAARRRRYAAEAVAAVVAELVSGLGVRMVEAHIDPANAASSALAASLGLARTDASVDGGVVWITRIEPGAG